MKQFFIITMILLSFVYSCSAESDTALHWSDSTHSKNVDPNYDIVFDQSKVQEFTIVIDSADWQVMRDDLNENLFQGKDGNPGGMRPERMGRPPKDGMGQPPKDGMGQPPKGNAMNDFDPVWVPSTVIFNGITWDKVGVRFKGNSSLRSAVSSGNNKLSFKLDFDEFEDEYPEIKNQRFYGFKQLNLNNNFSDQSLMREKIGADLFREFGLLAARTAFCVVYLDHGEGKQFFGVYTLVEEMDDTVIETQLGDDSGNLYKPDGTAATFAAGTFNEKEMEKKNNEDHGDYSDVRSLYDVINSDTRETDRASWKSDLESIFNVDGFLKWLAANTVMQNWDTYGNMSHNYYLYKNPETALLNWIPWDNNEALQDGKKKTLSLSLEEVDNSWPLIRYILDDPEYISVYKNHVQQFINELFISDKMIETYKKYYHLLKGYADKEVPGYTFIKSAASFDGAVEFLKSHVEQRITAAEQYLDK